MSKPVVVALMTVDETTAKQVHVPEDSPLRSSHGEKVVGGNVTLRCQYNDDNKSWAFYTPSGEIRMAIDNPDAFAAFVPGQQFYVHFVPVEG